jgi:arabinan endo-1,5-alpha-L-arabinosidase
MRIAGRLGGAVAVLAAIALCAALALTRPFADDPRFVNPVFRHDAPDPAVLRGRDGRWYAYTTQSVYGVELINLPVLRSDDLVRWERIGDALPIPPSWVTGDTWAPHVAHIGGRYVMYYSAGQRGTGTMAIGVATADAPEGPFTGLAEPLVTGPGFTAIDPFLLRWRGRPYLVWGSDGAPIRIQQLTDDGLSRVGAPRALLRPSGGDYERLIEGPWISRREPYWYLWYSGDACCGREANYAILVARGRSPLGPFTRRGEPVVEWNAEFFAPGHHSVVTDDRGDDWMLYHAMSQEDVSRGLFDVRYMLLDRIDWRDGWPVVDGGNGPTRRALPAPAAG